MKLPDSTPPLIEFNHVYVQRGENLALRDISLCIRDGENLAILGPNGCGKSTLIKTIDRECYPLLKPETSLRVAGQETWNVFELRSRLGIVSSELMVRCSRDITGRELVLSGIFGTIGLWPTHEVTADFEKRAADAMQHLSAGHLASRWLDELSSGEARRLLIARALIHNPRTLLLDEPTTALDLPTLRTVRADLRRLAKSGVGIVLVTHHLDDIIPEIERVVLLSGGAIVADGPKEEVLTGRRLSRLYGCPVEVVERSGYYHAW